MGQASCYVCFFICVSTLTIIVLNIVRAQGSPVSANCFRNNTYRRGGHREGHGRLAHPLHCFGCGGGTDEILLLCTGTPAVHGIGVAYTSGAQDTYEGIYLIEVFVGSKNRELKATFKADAQLRVPRFVEMFKEALRPLCRR